MSLQGPNSFATTHWSIVVAAGRSAKGGSPESAAALADLCNRYWYPLYIFVRRRVADLDEARDLTQEFFARLLEKNTLALADPERGRFRSFLLTAFKHFLINEWEKSRAQKRGGGRKALAFDFDSKEAQIALEPQHTWTPERLYERHWALTLLEQVLAQLRREYHKGGKSKLFAQLKVFLVGESAAASHAEAAERLGMTEGAVKVAAHRLRKRYRELLRQEVGQTVANESEIDDEIRALFRSLEG